MDVLIFAGLCLAVITILGHGIWVLSAKVLKAVFGGGTAASLPQPSRCRVCQSSKPTEAVLCDKCQRAMATTPEQKTNIGAIAVLKQIIRLEQLGILDAQTRNRMVDAITKESSCNPTLADFLESVTTRGRAKPDTDLESPLATADEAVPLIAEVVESPDADQRNEPATPISRERQRALVQKLGAPAATNADASPTPVAGERRESSQPRVAVSIVLASFMEEHSIRWGEIVGGLLIIGCSIALVISFWSEIASRPLLKFILFNSVTAGLFGVGLYADRRWQLTTTSLGILIISILLVPLNVLAIAAFTDQSPPSDVLSILGEVVSLAIFGGLTFLAARSVVPNCRLALTLGVIAPSVMQLLTRRFVHPDSSYVLLYALALVPVAGYWATAGAGLQWLSKKDDLEERDANELFILFGLVTYSALLPLALFLYKIWGAPVVIHDMSPMLSLLAIPAIAIGIFSWRRFIAAVPVTARMSGVAIGCLGVFAMGAAAFLAWPNPAVLLPATLIPGLLFLVVAVVWNLPTAYYGVSLALLIGWPLIANVLRGAIGWRSNTTELMSSMFSAPTGNLLIPLIGVMSGSAALLAGRKQEEEARVVAISTGVVAAVCLALVSWFGFGQAGDPYAVTFTYAVIGIMAYAAATVMNHRELTWAAAVTILGAVAQAILFRWPVAGTWLVRCATAGLVHASICTALAALLAIFVRCTDRVQEASSQASLITSIVASALVLVAWLQGLDVVVLPYAVWVSVIWFAIAMASADAKVFAAFQVAAAVTMLCAAVRTSVAESWYTGGRFAWLQPWFIQRLGLFLAAYSGAWSGLRRWLPAEVVDPVESVELVGSAEEPGKAAAEPAPSRSTSQFRTSLPPIGDFVGRLGSLVHHNQCRVDHGVAVIVVALVTCLAWYAAVPGVAQELAPRANIAGAVSRIVPPIVDFEIPTVPSLPAASITSWGLLVTVIAVVMLRARQWPSGTSKLLLLFLLSLACPLASARWLSDVSVASAMRWALAIFFLTASIPIWLRRRLPKLLSELVLPQSNRRVRGIAVGPAAGVRELDVAHALLFAITGAPFVLMGLYVASYALAVGGLPDAVARNLPLLATIASISLLVSGCIMFYPRAATVVADETQSARSNSSLQVGVAITFLGLSPLCVALMFAVAAALIAHPIVGPEPGSWFRAVGLPIAYAMPVLLIAITLVGHAIRERSASFAFAAGILFQVAATAGFMLAIPRMGRTLDALTWIHVAEINTIVAGSVSLAWLAYVTFFRQGKLRAVRIPSLLTSYVLIATSLMMATVLPGLGRLWWSPTVAPTLDWVIAIGGSLGWFAFGSVTAAVVWWGGLVRMSSDSSPADLTLTAGLGRFNISECGAGMLSALIVVALTIARWDTGNWLALHAIELGTAIALGLVVTGWWDWSRVDERVGAGVVGWSATFAAIAVLFAIRGSFEDGLGHWWSVGTIGWVAVASAILAWRIPALSLVFVAGLMWNLAATVWWVLMQLPKYSGNSAEVPIEFIHFNIIWALVSIAFSIVFAMLRQSSVGRGTRRFTYHGVVTILGALLFGLTVFAGLFADAARSPIANNVGLSVAAWVVLFTSGVAWYVERRGPTSVPIIYVIGLLGLALFQDRLDANGSLFWWTATMLLAAYGLGTSYLWSQRLAVRDLLSRLRIVPDDPLDSRLQASSRLTEPPTESAISPRNQSYGSLSWFITANGLVAIVVVALVGWIDLTFETLLWRVPASHAVLAQAFSLALLAKGTTRTPLQYASLALGAIFAVVFGWSWLQPHMDATVLHHAVVAVVAIAVVVVAYGFGLVKFLRRHDDWISAAERLIPVLVGVGCVALMFVMSCEVYHFTRDGQIPIQWSAIIALIVALAGLCAACVAAALLPGRDPLGLSERGKQAYIYAAEFVVALLGLHIRMTMPWLFHGWFTRFWPLVAMGIAFIGVGVGELMHRRRYRIVSDPLVTTGAFLPMLPVLSLWIAPAEVNYSLTLLAVGTLYATLSALRKSFLYAVLSTVAVNGSLWYLLHQIEGLEFLRHPQLWLIPPALCVLVSTRLCRRQLSDLQVTTIRYASAIVIYVASTADVFIIGVANAPWLPVVLAGFSLLGIFAGIILRVRAFLYLGVSFLLVSLLTVIWYAAVELERTWIWWVSGIVTGILIIALFAVFEKRRDETLELVESLKTWES